MVNSVFALALLAMSGSALAYQEQPVATEDAVEATTEAEDASATAETAAPDAPAEPAQAEEPAEDDAASDQELLRSATRAYSKCRFNAQRSGGMAAVASACASQRKRLQAAKDAVKASR
jgi:hypothetical protein